MGNYIEFTFKRITKYSLLIISLFILTHCAERQIFQISSEFLKDNDHCDSLCWWKVSPHLTSKEDLEKWVQGETLLLNHEFSCFEFSVAKEQCSWQTPKFAVRIYLDNDIAKLIMLHQSDESSPIIANADIAFTYFGDPSAYSSLQMAQYPNSIRQFLTLFYDELGIALVMIEPNIFWSTETDSSLTRGRANIEALPIRSVYFYHPDDAILIKSYQGLGPPVQDIYEWSSS